MDKKKAQKRKNPVLSVGQLIELMGIQKGLTEGAIHPAEKVGLVKKVVRGQKRILRRLPPRHL